MSLPGDYLLINATDQMWKLQLERRGLYFGFAAMVGPLFIPNAPSWVIFFPMIGLVVGLGTFVFACVGVRCPHCHERWFWRAVRTKGPLKAEAWLTGLHTCPSCGHTGS